MDDRTKLEKVRAIANDERGSPQIRSVAQRMLKRMMGGNDELAVSPTYEEAYRRYTEAYTHKGYVYIGKNGSKIKLPRVFKPDSIVNNRQLDIIFKHHVYWSQILTTMHRCVGCRGNEVIFESNESGFVHRAVF